MPIADGAGLHFYGVTDTLQARIDIDRFTLEGMVSWGALAVDYERDTDGDGDTDEVDIDYFQFGNSDYNPLKAHYQISDNKVYTGTIRGSNRVFNSWAYTATNTLQDSYYVNFLFHPIKDIDLGIGTKLNWKVGPAPRYGAWLWEPDAHVRQGGFSTAYDDRNGAYCDNKNLNKTQTYSTYKYRPDAPGSADVVGFVHYANRYAKTAMGGRYHYNNGDLKFEVGAAIPQGTNTDDPVVNLGLEVSPIKELSLAAAYEGLGQDYGNFYSGLTFDFTQFILEAYLAIDAIGGDSYYINGTGERTKQPMAYGTGAAITLNIDKVTLRPEAGINFFENKHFTPAFFGGLWAELGITKEFAFKAYGSFAVGSKDNRWDDDTYQRAIGKDTEDWTGGHIISARPEVEFKINSQHTLDAYFNFEHRKAFDGNKRNCWSTGIYWTYKTK